MTDGERMVWAAAYSGYLLKHVDGKFPPDMSLPQKWIDWEEEKVRLAAEWAWACVANLRQNLDGIQRKFSPSISEMAACIVEVTP